MPSEPLRLTDARWRNLRERLARSRFRSRFSLNEKERAYVAEKGMKTIQRHAQDFVRLRLAPAEPKNDGKQTPMRGHPVFIAQHATATCCRACLAKWHGIPKDHALSKSESAYVAGVVLRWIVERVSE